MPLQIISKNEFLVNTFTLGAQTSPDVAVLANGDIVFAWGNQTVPVVDGGDGLGYSVKFKIYNPDGSVNTGETRVNSFVDDNQSFPNIAAMSDGSFVIGFTTEETSADGSDYAVMASHFAAGGQRLSNDVVINTDNTSGSQTDVRLVEGASVEVVGVWVDGTGDGGANGAGIKIGNLHTDDYVTYSQKSVNVPATESQYDSDVAVNKDGVSLVVWTHGTLGSFDIKARLFNSDFTIRTAEFIANVGDQTDDQLYPITTALANGNFVIAYRTNDETKDGDGSAVGYTILDPTGAVVLSASVANANNTSSQSPQGIFALEDGRFVIAWATGDETADGNGSAVMARIFNANGTAYSDEFLVNKNATGSQTSIKGAAMQDGQIVFTWMANHADHDGSGSAIKARIFDIGSSWNGTGGADALNGNAGRDEMFGRGGDDTLSGFAGVDRLFGGNGADELKGGSGNDLLNGDAGADRLLGQGGKDELNGGDGADNLQGHAGNDTLNGGAKADILRGGTGADKLNGGGGADQLKGQGGNDVLLGGGGADKLWFGKGADTATGGAGKDLFFLAKREGQGNKITDFKDGADKLNLKAFGYGSKAKALDHFKDAGGANNDRIVFSDKNTKVVINGLDLSDLNGADILI